MSEIITDIDTEAENFFNIKELGPFVSKVLSIAIIIGALITLVYLVWGAIDWMMSEGNQEKLKSARNKITHAIIGLALIALVWLIWRLVLYFLGIGVITDDKVILPVSSPS